MRAKLERHMAYWYPGSVLLKWKQGKGEHSHLAAVLMQTCHGEQVGQKYDSKQDKMTGPRYGFHSGDRYASIVTKIA